MGYIDIRKLSLDELLGVVNLYPWFGGARKELCERMHRMGGDAWGESQYADAAMYIPSRTRLVDMVRTSGGVISAMGLLPIYGKAFFTRLSIVRLR